MNKHLIFSVFILTFSVFTISAQAYYRGYGNTPCYGNTYFIENNMPMRGADGRRWCW